MVRRVFELFVTGTSPIAVARALNTEGVQGPQGRFWRDTTIRGHAGRGTGILRNQLYVSRLVWNRLSYAKEPTTGRRVSRPNARVQLIAREAPELRILDQEVWEQAQQRLGAIRATSGGRQTGPPSVLGTAARPVCAQWQGVLRLLRRGDEQCGQGLPRLLCRTAAGRVQQSRRYAA